LLGNLVFWSMRSWESARPPIETGLGTDSLDRMDQLDGILVSDVGLRKHEEGGEIAIMAVAVRKR